MEGAEERCNQRSKETAFVGSLDDLCGVAYADTMKLLNIEEDRKFLEAQREKGRRGCMGAQWTQSYHIASWMAKLINCFKIYLYQSQFRLILRELSRL